MWLKVLRFVWLAFVYTGYAIISVLRYPAFSVLRILRLPVQLFCGAVAFSATIGIPAVWIGLDPSHGLKTPTLILMVVGLVVTSLVSWFYDSLLLRLAPLAPGEVMVLD